jgi:hypothetical protein
VVTEHTQNKAQFGRAGNLGPRNLTASGISHREIGHWVLWITRNIFGINYSAIFSGEGQLMRFSLRLIVGMVMCVSVTTLHAQDDDKPKDAEGCKDSPLITRFPGSIIHSCDNKEFEQADFPMADSQQKHLEGEYHHTDNQGNAAPNQALSERRAQAVVAWLTAHGVAASRLSAKGMGQTKPVADNGGDEGRSKNRRVELVKQ